MIIRNQPTNSPFLFSKNSPNKLQSGKFNSAGSGVTDSAIANYPFTSDLLNTISPFQSLVSAVNPTPSASGISLVTANNSKIVTTGFPVNDFVITSTVRFDENPPSSVIVFENEWFSNSDLFNIYLKNGTTPESLKSAAFTTVTLSSMGSVSGRTFDFTWTQSSVDGLTLAAVEVGGSGYSDTSTNSTAAGKADVPAWTGFIDLAERSNGTLQVDETIKDWRIDPL